MPHDLVPVEAEARAQRLLGVGLAKVASPDSHAVLGRIRVAEDESAAARLGLARHDHAGGSEAGHELGPRPRLRKRGVDLLANLSDPRALPAAAHLLLGAGPARRLSPLCAVLAPSPHLVKMGEAVLLANSLGLVEVGVAVSVADLHLIATGWIDGVENYVRMHDAALVVIVNGDDRLAFGISPAQPLHGDVGALLRRDLVPRVGRQNPMVELSTPGLLPEAPHVLHLPRPAYGRVREHVVGVPELHDARDLRRVPERKVLLHRLRCSEAVSERQVAVEVGDVAAPSVAPPVVADGLEDGHASAPSRRHSRHP